MLPNLKCKEHKPQPRFEHRPPRDCSHSHNELQNVAVAYVWGTLKMVHVYKTHAKRELEHTTNISARVLYTYIHAYMRRCVSANAPVMQNAKSNAQFALPNEVFTFQCAIWMGAGPFRLWQNSKLHVGSVVACHEFCEMCVFGNGMPLNDNENTSSSKTLLTFANYAAN